MPIVDKGSLGSNQSKTSGTSIAISVGSVAVAVGDLILVGLAIDDAGSGFTCADNLGNTYTLRNSTINAGNARAYLFESIVSVAGTLTSITASWTSSVTAKAIAARLFSGAQFQTGSLWNTQSESDTFATLNANAGVAGELMMGVAAWERPNGDTLTVFAPSGNTAQGIQNGTTGGGATTNMTVHLVTCIRSNANSGSLTSSHTTARAFAAAGADYEPTPEPTVERIALLNDPLIRPIQAVERSRRW